MRLAFCTSFAILVSGAAAAAPAWVQLAPGGRVLARTVVEGACPSITIDGNRSSMKARSAPGADGKAPAGQRLVCESDVTGAKGASIGAAALKLPVSNPKRIVVIGDTGCRIKVTAHGPAAQDTDHEGEKVKVQDCNDSKQWPFAAVAKAAMESKPDLIVHVGDYIYRESQCPPDRASACGGSPWGDNWRTWQADFFSPGEVLLAAAPWIFVRGNHEICARAGKGWFYYLDGGTYAADGQCSDESSPYVVKLGSFSAVVLDSSNAPDVGPTPAQVDSYAKSFSEIASSPLSGAWLLSHRPLWAAKSGGKGERDNLFILNATLQGAWTKAPIPGVELIVAGHTHLFELLSFSKARPTQLVIGNGGTSLAHRITTKLAGKSIGAATVVTGTSLDEFGYALMSPRAGGAGWSLQMHDARGAERLTCSIAPGKTKCAGS